MMARTPADIAWRLAVTVAAVYTLFFTPVIGREMSLAVALVERGVALPSRGEGIVGNPGAAMIGALPYAVARPLLERVYAARPALVSPKPPLEGEAGPLGALNELRARGLDVRLAAAAAVMHLGVDVPLAVAGVLLMYGFLLDRIGRPREAQWFSLLYVFGTPLLLTSTSFDVHVPVVHLTCGALLALVWRRGDGPNTVAPDEPWRPVVAGACLGMAILCDSAMVAVAAVFVLWVAIVSGRRGGVTASLTSVAAMSAGALPSLLLLLAYQHAASGDMSTSVQAAASGLTPTASGAQVLSRDLLWRALFGLDGGLLVACPLLALALAAPWRANRRAMLRREETWLLLGASAAVYLAACLTVGAHRAAPSGVRALSASVPLLFLAALPVLRGVRKWLAWSLVTSSVVISWVLAMTGAGVTGGLKRLALHGLELPWMTALSRVPSAYLAELPRSGTPTLLYALLSGLLWWVWRKRPNE